MPAYSTVQAGSTVIGSATGDSLIVAPGDENRFGIGADLIVWSAGMPLDPAINYDTMTVTDKTANTLTVLRNEDHALDTIAEGDQVGLFFPRSRSGPYQQTQVLTFGKDDGFGPTIDLGADALGIIGLITAVTSDVNLDGATPGESNLVVSLDSSFDGTNWALPNDSEIHPGSGGYSPWSLSYLAGSVFTSKLMSWTDPTDPAPLYAHAVTTRYIRFKHVWTSYPSELGINATATITFDISYY